jgi:hypothetical protein
MPEMTALLINESEVWIMADTAKELAEAGLLFDAGGVWHVKSEARWSTDNVAALLEALL